jgi:hypothetical protein
MTDKDILTMLTSVAPENYSQWKKLKKCILIWMGNDIDHTDDYVSTLTESQVVDRECMDVYEEYTDWCKLNYITPVHINAFTKYIHYYFNAKSKSLNGKRYYCK